MAVITISRGTYTKGKEIAEKVAEKLGYNCISREVLLEASREFNIPEIKLERAIHDAPSVLERFSFGKEKYIAFIRKAILEYATKGNMVYHGLAGHFFFQDIPSVLKVRIIADMNSRVKEEMERRNISEEEARYLLHKDDEERRKWSLYLYGIDTWDSRLYDLVINVRWIKVDDAVDCICKFAQLPYFRSTPESENRLKEALVQAKCKVALINDFPKAKVYVSGKKVEVIVPEARMSGERIKKKVEELLSPLSLEEVEVRVQPKVIPD